jgi:hypothetical protein
MTQTLPVDLEAFVWDLEPRAIKKGVPAPVGYHVDCLLEFIRRELPDLWPVRPAELVAALALAAEPDADQLRHAIALYKGIRAWEVRHRLGEATERHGTWDVVIRSRGERVS